MRTSGRRRPCRREEESEAPALAGLFRQPVANVTPDALATLLAAKNKSHHRQAVALYVRLRHFYRWLATPGPRVNSAVGKGHLDDLVRPKRPKAKEGRTGRSFLRCGASASAGRRWIAWA